MTVEPMLERTLCSVEVAHTLSALRVDCEAAEWISAFACSEAFLAEMQPSTNFAASLR